MKDDNFIFSDNGTVSFTEETASNIKVQTKHYMHQIYIDAIDSKTGELNTTKLAEIMADEWDLYAEDHDYAIPEDLFEWAVEVEDELIKAKKVQPMFPK